VSSDNCVGFCRGRIGIRRSRVPWNSAGFCSCGFSIRDRLDYGIISLLRRRRVICGENAEVTSDRETIRSIGNSVEGAIERVADAT
jgi:hypothetical protein